jgi:hypothetical protein
MGHSLSFCTTAKVTNVLQDVTYACLVSQLILELLINLLLILTLVHLDMDKDGADCGPLIERTAETLNDDTLKQLFISTQQTTLELCMRYAVEK